MMFPRRRQPDAETGPNSGSKIVAANDRIESLGSFGVLPAREPVRIVGRTSKGESDSTESVGNRSIPSRGMAWVRDPPHESRGVAQRRRCLRALNRQLADGRLELDWEWNGFNCRSRPSRSLRNARHALGELR